MYKSLVANGITWDNWGFSTIFHSCGMDKVPAGWGKQEKELCQEPGTSELGSAGSEHTGAKLKWHTVPTKS